MPESFKPLVVTGLPSEAALRALRTNCLGSLYYFIKIGLRRRRLTDHLHKPLCIALERDHIKDAIEWPRDHFKSTIGAEGLPMWRSLPFGQADIDHFSSLGYSAEFIEWMKRKHNPDTRNLLVSENITNGAKLGKKIRWHYESNATFRALFSEILPTTDCVWTNYSLNHRRSAQGGGHGEGTFDFLGVGSALQSRHYNGILVQDDLVGRKAIESQSVLDSTINYHQLLVGAFEDEDKFHESDELVIGNRWGFHDLESHIREHESWFRVTMHSALGGCCPEHPQDTPIFPEEWTVEKLLKRKERLGTYHFSCQYLNNPSSPENAEFRKAWLGFYSESGGYDESGTSTRVIRHEVKDGLVHKDVKVFGNLRIGMAVDPAHSSNAGAGRCRHAIVVVGLSAAGDYYLLEPWAESCGYEAFFNKIFELAEKWRVRKVGFETVAAQRFAAYHIEFLNRSKAWPIRIEELRGEVESPDGTLTHKKNWRIRNVLSPIFESGRFWCQRKHMDFIAEYETFPKSRFVDQLDALAYIPGMLKVPMNQALATELLRNNQLAAQRVNAAYTIGESRYA